MSGTIKILSLKAFNLAAMDIGGSSDPYYFIYLCDDEGKSIGAKAKGDIQKNNLNPAWTNLSIAFDLPASDATQLKIELYDHDFIGSDDFLGEYHLPISELKPGVSTITGKVSSRPMKNDPVSGNIEIIIDFTPTKPSEVQAPAANVQSRSFPPFDYSGFEEKRNAALDAYEAIKRPRVAEWNKLSADEKKQKIQELVESAETLKYPAPAAFLPALAQQYLQYAPLESPHLLFYTVKEFGIDDKLPKPRPFYFYQIPGNSDDHPKWPKSWHWMHTTTSRLGYSIGGEMKGPAHLWSLSEGPKRTPSFLDLVRLVQIWCHAPADVKAEYLFGVLDRNGSGYLEVDEIAQGEAATMEEFAFVLTTVIKNGINHVRPETDPELSVDAIKEKREAMLAVFAKHYNSIMDEAINNLLALADKDGDGKLSMDEYQILLEAPVQAQLKVWYNSLAHKCMDLFVKEGVLTEAFVAPYRAFDLF
eukprot:TRINITY_DN12374_c0_g1_i1.p1 TRINITY_DN12374_c0_g1~~TRINITY_DN12374_c0_g1_i1.p1  ORF type:complete len:495 (-),score=111.80 TRINITY_DN12374_c0_g1_i1:62-1486(-)